MKIAVSACLLGENCKYNGGNNLCPEVTEFIRGHEVIPVCPERAGGLPVPRIPAEIRDGRVINRSGGDMDGCFCAGAERELARAGDADLAILQPRSPSCGVHQVYDGTFTGTLCPGSGVFARKLIEAGIRTAEPWELEIPKPIRLVAMDMDGTLLDGHKQLPPDFVSWVLAHPEICVVVASGRQIASLYALFPGLEDRLYFMSDNGALIMYRGKELFSDRMEVQDVRRVLDLIHTIQGAEPVLCGMRSAYIEQAAAGDTRETGKYYARLLLADDLSGIAGEDSVLKVAVHFPDGNAASWLPLLQTLTGRPNPLLTGPAWIDINNREVSKGRALRMLMQRLGISREECMAFGDYLNDVDMLEAVGESYAMANALPQVRQIARHITASNENEGVMRILRQL